MKRQCHRAPGIEIEPWKQWMQLPVSHLWLSGMEGAGVGWTEFVSRLLNTCTVTLFVLAFMSGP